MLDPAILAEFRITGDQQVLWSWCGPLIDKYVRCLVEPGDRPSTVEDLEAELSYDLAIAIGRLRNNDVPAEGAGTSFATSYCTAVSI